jgi:two-component system, cell cycle response regulator
VPFDGAALVHAAQGHFDCILIGCAQPQQGEALLRQIRTLDRVRTTPTLIVVDAGQGPQATRLLASGAVDRIDGTANKAEFGLRLAAMGERKALLDVLRARNLTHQTLNGMDAATGLQGVDFLRRALATTAARMTAQGKPFSLMVVGIDWHPDLMDSQSIPESIMRPVADVLRRSLRGFDLACRIGGDSFAILMPGADATGAQNAASRLCSEIGAEKVRVTDKRKDGITASIGVATLAGNGAAQSADTLFDTACAALQAARAEGAAQVHLVQSAA